MLSQLTHCLLTRRAWIALTGSYGVTTGLMGCHDATPRPAGPMPVPITQRHGGGKPIRVVTTVGMVSDLVQKVGGAAVSVTGLCGPGVDPHLFKPTRDHVAQILNSDLVVYAGLRLEGKLDDLLLRLSQRHPVYAVASGLPVQRLLPLEGGRATAAVGGLADGEGGTSVVDPQRLWAAADPHVWMDVDLWSLAAAGVAEMLAGYDPVGAGGYRDRAAAYRGRLADLHRYGQQAIASIPSAARLLVTSHDAFRYFGKAYGIEVLGVQGFSTDSEAGLRRINSLVDHLVARRIPAVFVESSVSPKSLQSMLEGVRSRGHELRVGGQLFADAMGPAGTYQGSYLGMMDHNFTTISRGLGGDSPAGGWQGRLGARSNMGMSWSIASG